MNLGYFVEGIIRPGNAIVKAFNAGFHRLVQRCRPRPVGSRLMMARYTHLSAAVSVGKCPRALTALRIRALIDSIAFVSGMKEVGTPAGSSSGPAPRWGERFAKYGATIRDRGCCGETQIGQAGLHDGLRARVSRWPPLRLVRVRCERESVVVVSPVGFPVQTNRVGRETNGQVYRA